MKQCCRPSIDETDRIRALDSLNNDVIRTWWTNAKSLGFFGAERYPNKVPAEKDLAKVAPKELWRLGADMIECEIPF